ncbi:MAG: 3'-5' exonuclease, partial [Thiobacillus sp.]
WLDDQKYLPPGTNGNVSEKVLNLARAYKTCVEALLPAVQKDAIKETLNMTAGKPYAMLLSRANMVYGLNLEEFKNGLVKILHRLTNEKEDRLNQLIDAVTAHRSKGREAHTAIILDATERKFPMVHPDNLLFRPFGVTPSEVLEEERRLFYVAITRAEHRLIVLTDKHVQSPYLTALTHPAAFKQFEGSEMSERHTLGPLASRIKERIEATHIT